MNNINFGIMFDLLIAAYGVFMLVSANKMKQTGEPSPTFLPRYELDRCIDKRGFISEVYPKILLFASIIFAYGVLEMVNDYILRNPYVDTVGKVVFIITFVWFVLMLKKLRKKYIR